MAAAPKVGRGMKTLAPVTAPSASVVGRSPWTGPRGHPDAPVGLPRVDERAGPGGPARTRGSAPPMRALVLLMLAAISAPAATYYLTIAGLGGEADYRSAEH